MLLHGRPVDVRLRLEQLDLGRRRLPAATPLVAACAADGATRAGCTR